MGFALLPLGAFSGHPVSVVRVAVGIAISRAIRDPWPPTGEPYG